MMKSSTQLSDANESLCKFNPNKNADNESINNSLIFVSGTSGTGKSALIQKGLGDHASKLGYTFISGKFDDKLRSPLSAFSDAMTCLARHIMVDHYKKEKLSSGAGELSAATLIRDKIQNELDEEDVEQLQRVFPGCAGLLALSDVSPLRSASGRKLWGSKRRDTLVFAGEESISRVHFAIRRLLKVICSHLKGVVLFINDLQWSDTATLELLKSIVSDGEIPSLLIVGAYREDEAPE
jgi:predicted ATPase